MRQSLPVASDDRRTTTAQVTAATAPAIVTLAMLRAKLPSAQGNTEPPRVRAMVPDAAAVLARRKAEPGVYAR